MSMTTVKVPDLPDEPMTGSFSLVSAESLLAKALDDLNFSSVSDALAGEPRPSPKQLRNVITAWIFRWCKDASGRGVKDAEDRASITLDLLELQVEKAISEVSTNEPKRLNVLSPSGPPPLPKSAGELLPCIDTVDGILRSIEWRAATNYEYVGSVAAMLVYRSGICSMKLLGAALCELIETTTVCTSSMHSWINVELELEGHHQRRRIFLDPATLVASARVATCIRAIRGEFADRQEPTIRQIVDEGWRALRARYGSNTVLPHRIQGLMDATSAAIQLNSMPLLASYARGEIASTSFDESTWIKILGATSTAPQENPTRKSSDAQQMAHASMGLGLIDEAISEPFDKDPFLTKLSSATRDAIDRPSALLQIDSIMDALQPGQTQWYLTGWIRYLLKDARYGKGRMLRLSTVNFMRGTMASRLLGVFPDRLDALTGDELTDLYQEIIDSVTSSNLRMRVADFIHRFNAFCISQTGLRIDGHYQLPSRRGIDAAVSARFISENDYQRALHLLEVMDAGKITRDDRDAAKVFLTMTYRFGARRSEIIGLTLNDTRNGILGCNLEICDNEARPLKTRNAKRSLPFSLLDGEERKALSRFWMGRYKFAQRLASESSMSNSGHELWEKKWLLRKATFLFFETRELASLGLQSHRGPRLALKALRMATSDTEIHLHHLRHSFGTRNVLGAVIDDLDHDALHFLPEAMLALREQSRSFHTSAFARIGRTARRGSLVSMAMGHGSDETTYRHYVHGFDLLVYSVVSARRLRLRRHRDGVISSQSVSHSEGVLIGKILGLSSQQVAARGYSISWLVDQAEAEGLVLRRFVETKGSRKSAPSLEWALDQRELQTAVGEPKTPREYESARLSLRLFDDALRLRQVHATRVLELVGLRAGKDGWSSLSFDEANVLEKDFRHAFGSAMRLDFHRRITKGRSQTKEPFSVSDLSRLCQVSTSRVYVRIADPKAPANSVRQRASKTTLWAVKATLHWLNAQGTADLL